MADESAELTTIEATLPPEPKGKKPFKSFIRDLMNAGFEVENVDYGKTVVILREGEHDGHVATLSKDRLNGGGWFIELACECGAFVYIGWRGWKSRKEIHGKNHRR